MLRMFHSMFHSIPDQELITLIALRHLLISGTHSFRSAYQPPITQPLTKNLRGSGDEGEQHEVAPDASQGRSDFSHQNLSLDHQNLEAFMRDMPPPSKRPPRPTIIVPSQDMEPIDLTSPRADDRVPFPATQPNPRIARPQSGSTHAKNVFLTWPHNDTAKEIIIHSILEHDRLKGHIEYVVVCEETHEDGEPHIHALVILDNRFRVNNKVWDEIGGKHGDYKAARDIAASITYVKKDGNWCDQGQEPLFEHNDKKDSKTQRIFDAFQKGVTFDEVIDLAGELLQADSASAITRPSSTPTHTGELDTNVKLVCDLLGTLWFCNLAYHNAGPKSTSGSTPTCSLLALYDLHNCSSGAKLSWARLASSTGWLHSVRCAGCHLGSTWTASPMTAICSFAMNSMAPIPPSLSTSSRKALLVKCQLRDPQSPRPRTSPLFFYPTTTLHHSTPPSRTDSEQHLPTASRS